MIECVICGLELTGENGGASHVYKTPTGLCSDPKCSSALTGHVCAMLRNLTVERAMKAEGRRREAGSGPPRDYGPLPGPGGEVAETFPDLPPLWKER